MGSTISSIIFPIPPKSYDETRNEFRKIPYSDKYADNYSWISSITTSCISLQQKQQQNEYIPAYYFFNPINTVTIVYSHGNATDIGRIYDWMDIIHQSCQVNIVCYDYVGYGSNTGKPSEQGCYDCINSVYEYLVTDNNINSNDIILFGRSIGTGPTVDLASRLSKNDVCALKGIILQSPYTSIFGVVSQKIATASMCIDKFRNKSKIDSVTCPITVLHGDQDEIIPFDHAEKLHRKSQKCRLIKLEDGGHNDLEYYFKDVILSEISKMAHTNSC